MEESAKSAADMNVYKLIASLRIGQLWAIVVILAGLLGSSFGLGYKTHSLLTESRIAQFQAEIGNLQTRTKQFRGLQTKARFLEFYVMYLTAKHDFEATPSHENRKAKDEISGNFIAYVKKLVVRGEESRDDIDPASVYLSKGSHGQAIIKFGYDGSTWDVPLEFGFCWMCQ